MSIQSALAPLSAHSAPARCRVSGFWASPSLSPPTNATRARRGEVDDRGGQPEQGPVLAGLLEGRVGDPDHGTLGLHDERPHSERPHAMLHPPPFGLVDQAAGDRNATAVRSQARQPGTSSMRSGTDRERGARRAGARGGRRGVPSWRELRRGRAWRERFGELRRRAQALTALDLDEVRLVGPGTDLRIGLLPTARWEPPTNVNVHGIEPAWNLPSEEVYTVPDPELLDPAERDRVNQSKDHLDVSIGSDEVSVTGHDRAGRGHALLHAGRWQF
jgi:Thermophilic metalloprotease (M29)